MFTTWFYINHTALGFPRKIPFSFLYNPVYKNKWKKVKKVNNRFHLNIILETLGMKL